MTLNKLLLLAIMFVCLTNISNGNKNRKASPKKNTETENLSKSKIEVVSHPKVRTTAKSSSNAPKFIEDGDIAAITVGKKKPYRKTEDKNKKKFEKKISKKSSLKKVSTSKTEDKSKLGKKCVVSNTCFTNCCVITDGIGSCALNLEGTKCVK